MILAQKIDWARFDAAFAEFYTCRHGRAGKSHGCQGDTQIHIAGVCNKDASRTLRKRRSPIEPLIGHMKSDHRMGRCFLKGLLGDAINAVPAAVGRNFRKLLRWVFALIFGPIRAAQGWKLPSRRVHCLATTA